MPGGVRLILNFTLKTAAPHDGPHWVGHAYPQMSSACVWGCGGGGECTSMNEAVVPRDVGRRSKPDADFGVRRGGELGAPGAHQLLTVKRLPGAVFALTIVHHLCTSGQSEPDRLRSLRGFVVGGDGGEVVEG